MRRWRGVWRRAAVVAIGAILTGLSLPIAAHAVVGPASWVRIAVTSNVVGASIEVDTTTATGDVAPGAVVTVTRSSPSGTVTVGAVTTGPDGRASLLDPSLTLTEVTYRAVLATGAIAVQTFDRLPALPRVNVPLPAPLGDRLVTIPQGYVDLVVDDAHGRVFISDGGGVLVFDADGQQIGSVANVAGAEGLALSNDSTTLFVATDPGSSIDVVDTSTMSYVGYMPIPHRAGAPYLYLYRLGRAADRLVLSYEQTDSVGALGAIPMADPSRGAISFTDHATGASAGVMVAGDPLHPRAIVVNDTSAAEATGYDVSGPVPVITNNAYAFPPSRPSSVASVTYASDGSDLYVASGPPTRMDPSTWAVRSTYFFGGSTGAIAPTRDNRFVAAEFSGYGISAQVRDRTGAVTVNDFNPDPPYFFHDTVGGTLAFSGDSSRLYAVRMINGNNGFEKQFVTWANPLAPCSLQLNSSLDPAGTQLTARAVVTNRVGAVAGAVVTFSYTTSAGALIPFGARVTTAADGAATTTATLPAPLPGTDVTASVSIAGSIAPCALRVHVLRPAPPVLHAASPPRISYVGGGRGIIYGWWQAPADTGGGPIVGYSFVVIDQRGAVRAWVNALPSRPAALAQVPAGTYTVDVIPFNGAGWGHYATVTNVLVT